MHGKVILVHASAYAPAAALLLRLRDTFDGGDAGTVTMLPSLSRAEHGARRAPGHRRPRGGLAQSTWQNRTLEIYAHQLRRNSASASCPPTRARGAHVRQAHWRRRRSPADAGGLGLVEGVDYWDIGTLPAGTLADGTTTLLAVTGCAPGRDRTTPRTTARCRYDVRTGNLGIWAAKLDTTTPLDGGSIGAQFAYASFPFSSESTLRRRRGGRGRLLRDHDLVTPGGRRSCATRATRATRLSRPRLTPVPVTVPYPIAEGVTYGQLAPAALAPVSGVTFDGTSGFFVNTVTADGGPTPVQIGGAAPEHPGDLRARTRTRASSPTASGYVFVLVGDPGQPPFTCRRAPTRGSSTCSRRTSSAFPTNPPFGN